MNLAIVILAAGKGTRMHSQVPKVLHQVAGKTLLEQVVATAQQLAPASLFIVYSDARVKESGRDWQNVQWIEQREQLGTGDAVKVVLPQIAANSTVLVLYGDCPLITSTTLARLLTHHSVRSAAATLLTVNLADPTGFGRIIRNASGAMQAIIEQRDATEAELAICEVNTGILVTSQQVLSNYLPRLVPQNAQREYYLTDLVKLLVSDHQIVESALCEDALEVFGINDLVQLAQAERAYQIRTANALMRRGLAIQDPQRFDLVAGTIVFDEDVTIAPNVMLSGEVILGANTTIAMNNIIKNSRIGARVKILPNCVIEDAEIGDDCVIGPFARVRPGSKLQAGVHLGNFVEVKNSILGAGSKANHLSYLGDSTIGERVNIGAGTITCNYDGVNKHRTTIEDEAFIGSNTALVAPVTVGRRAVIGAGSTVVKMAPKDKLTVTRAEQVTIDDWIPPRER